MSAGVSAGSLALPPRIGRYERTVDGSLERVWENVHDWEHLPWLHRSSFRSIALLESGDWGWRARLGLPGQPDDAGVVIVLRRRPGELAYDVTTLEGAGTGNVVATRLEELGPERVGVEVGFHAPGIGDAAAGPIGDAFAALYERLWDEDQEMIAGRAAALACPPPRVPSGAEAELGKRARLDTPLDFALAGRRFRLVEIDGELFAHDATCPHRLGPLTGAPDPQGRVACPWHGYAFDARSGRSADGRGLRLAPAPRVEIVDGRVRVVAP